MRQSSMRFRLHIGAVTFFFASVLVATVGTGVTPAAAAAAKCGSSTGASWDQNLTGACRFTVLADFGGAAVRDNNTGLVWEQAPATTKDLTTNTWAGALFTCLLKNVGGTRGWRLPSVVELASLIDSSLPAPFVPASVFTGVQSAEYWSATTNQPQPSAAWFLDFSNLGINSVNIGLKTSGVFFIWCVRGDMNADQY